MAPPSLRLLLLLCLSHPTSPLSTGGSGKKKAPGMRRLQTRDEIRSVREGRVGSILDTRLAAALAGRAVVGEQPAHLRSGLSAEEERERTSIVARHFSFAPLDEAAEAALAAELAQVGGTLAEGLGLRNQLYRNKDVASRSRLSGAQLPASWDRLEESAAALCCPPLTLLRTMIAARPVPKPHGRLSPRLASGLVECLVEAHATTSAAGTHLSTDAVIATRRLRKLRYAPQRAVKAAVLHFDKDGDRDGSFLRAAAWACANDLQGTERKQDAQRRSRAAERLVIRRIRAAGIRGRTEAQLVLRRTTPDFVVDYGPREATRSGLRWVDVKHGLGQGNATKLADIVERYCEDWGPGAIVFTLGYTEAFADELRTATPTVWVLDPAAGERLLGSDWPS